MNSEGNSGSLMSRRVKWSEPSIRNINLAAAHNLEWRRKRIKQRNLTAEIHSRLLKTEEDAGPRPQEVAIQTTSSAEMLCSLKEVYHHSHWQNLPAIFLLGTYTMYNNFFFLNETPLRNPVRQTRSLKLFHSLYQKILLKHRECYMENWWI